MENCIPISMVTSNIQYVNSLEEFEKIPLSYNQTILCFDNTQPCFYIRERDRTGEYSRVKIYFYENFAQRVQGLKVSEFVEKCKKAGLNEFDTKIAEKMFIENIKNDDLWDCLLKNKRDVEFDSVRTIKWRIRKKLTPELIKHPKKKIIDNGVDI